MGTETIIWEGITITDWIKAIGVLLGIPVAVWGIISLFRKDKKHGEKLNRLEMLVATQEGINQSLTEQLGELKAQTEILHNRNLYQIDHNKMTERQLDLELQKYQDESVVRFEDLREYVIEVLKGLEGPINNQVRGFDVALGALSKRVNLGFEIIVDPSLRITNLKNINNQDLYKIFVQKNALNRDQKISSFLKLEKSVALIEYVKKELRKDVTLIFKVYRKHEDEWGDKVQKIRSCYESLLIENLRDQRSADSDPFVAGLDSIFANWLENAEKVNIRDLYYLRVNLIEPVKMLCNRHIIDPRTKDIISLCTEAEVSFVNMDTLRNRLFDVISNYRAQLVAAWNNIEFSNSSLKIISDE